MRPSFAPLLRCPRCLADGSLTLDARASDAREAREGTLSCGRCAATFGVRDGIADLLDDPPGFVRREAAGLERFAQAMRDDGWDADRIRALPDVDLPYWHGQARAIRRVLAEGGFRPGERIVDVGSNTCWASNLFAREGLEVVALDIATTELQGLKTAEHFFAGEDGVFFERLLSVMFAPALASGSMDHAFCCEVLHHNDIGNLRRTFAELHRVLRPGGRVHVVNEPLRFPLRLKRDHAAAVAEFEGYEHVYFLHQYVWAARRAGFRVRITGLEPSGSAPRRAARFAWRHLLRGDANLSLECVKPGEQVDS